MRNIILEGSPDFIVFFDDVCMDYFIENFNSRISVSGATGSSTLRVLFFDELYKAIPQQTIVRIFSKNIFNNKYNLISEGGIQGRNKSYTPSMGNTLSYTANDYMHWLQLTPFPIRFSSDAQMQGYLKFLYASRSMTPDSSLGLVSEGDSKFKGKDLKETIEKIFELVNDFNAGMRDKESNLAWLNLKDKIKVLGDISPDLRSFDPLVDLYTHMEGEASEHIYVLLNSILSRLMFELFQDRDGTIKVKPPFWNEDILNKYIIDPTLIQGSSESTNWANQKTRIISQGAPNDIVKDLSRDKILRSIVVPMGTYLGDGSWIDGNHTISEGSYENLTQLTDLEREIGVRTYMVNQPLIKFNSTWEEEQQGQSTELLKRYSSYVYNVLLSELETAQLNLVSMPWLRPGLNMWFDPLGEDKVGYINQISHVGDHNEGVQTSVGLSMLRRRGVYKDTIDDNVFVNEKIVKAKDMGNLPPDKDVVYQKFRNYYKGDKTIVAKSNLSPYFRSFYSESEKADPSFANPVFGGDLTKDEIIMKLHDKYQEAPEVVRERRANIDRATKQCIKDATKKYVINKLLQKGGMSSD